MSWLGCHPSSHCQSLKGTGITSKTSDDAYVLDFLQLIIHVQILLQGSTRGR